ncbi:MAG TPA: prevent-host-death protein [Deltaproteobacteria bacterium]|nr:prevent-host-death protein [Deltaproteobacteria bacterium]
MTTVTVEEIQNDVPGYLRRVQAGEAFTVIRGNEAIAEIRPICRDVQQPRPIGSCAGEFVVPDDFDAPLPEDIVLQFEGR